jgi:hypothetical protein
LTLAEEAQEMTDNPVSGEGKAGFDPDVLGRLQVTDEVVLRVTRPDGSTSSRRIWVVVEAGAPYIRAVSGPRGVWYRLIQQGAAGTLLLPGLEVPFDTEHVDDPRTRERISRAYREKYEAQWPGPTQSMVTETTAAATLRLRPRAA